MRTPRPRPPTWEELRASYVRLAHQLAILAESKSRSPTALKAQARLVHQTEAAPMLRRLGDGAAE